MDEPREYHTKWRQRQILHITWKWKSLSPVDSLQLYSPWNSPGQSIGVGSLSLLQEIFPTQGLNPGLMCCRQILYQLSHQGSPANVLFKIISLRLCGKLCWVSRSKFIFLSLSNFRKTETCVSCWTLSVVVGGCRGSPWTI